MSSAPTKRWRPGLRTRIVVYTSAVIAATLAAALVWSAFNLRAVLQDRNDAFLRHELGELAGSLSEIRDDSTSETAQDILRREAQAAEEAGLYVLLTHEGKTEVLPAGARPAHFEQAVRASAPDETPRTIAMTGVPAGVRTAGAVVAPTPDQRWTIVLGLPLTDSEQTAANFNSRLATGSALFLVIAVLGGLFLSRQAIQPVADSLAAAQKLNPADLSARLPRTGAGDDLDLLAATVNDLLDRLARYHLQTIQFTADASHELRGPLASMQAAIEVALQQPRSAAEHQELLASISEQCHRLTDLVNDLLWLAKADAGQIELQRVPVDLAEVVAEAVDTYKPLAEEKGISLDCQTSNHFVCQGDRMRLLQLTMNLVDNAIKFTPEGGRVTVKLAASSGSAGLMVEDSGIGIPPERLSRIFERFYQVDDSRSNGGTGLGLSICRWVVQAHGGTIDVSSHPGRGTEFRVSLPCR